MKKGSEMWHKLSTLPPSVTEMLYAVEIYKKEYKE